MKCPFCGTENNGAHLCKKCGSYDVVEGYENKKYKDQPYQEWNEGFD